MLVRLLALKARDLLDTRDATQAAPGFERCLGELLGAVAKPSNIHKFGDDKIAGLCNLQRQPH